MTQLTKEYFDSTLKKLASKADIKDVKEYIANSEEKLSNLITLKIDSLARMVHRGIESDKKINNSHKFN